MKNIAIIFAFLAIAFGHASGQISVVKPQSGTNQSSSSAQTPANQPSSSGQIPVGGPGSDTPPPPPGVSDPDGEINGHGYVDLGLPSGLKWGWTNLGASAPGKYGSYYAWSATRPDTDGKAAGMDGATLVEEGIVGDTGNLTMDYDAASAWGGTWRMPTEDELNELKEECQWTWITIGGHKGYKVTGKNGKSIFFPAAGWCEESGAKYVGESGNYWSSTLYSDGIYSCYINFRDGKYINVGRQKRSVRRSVRPVSD